MLLGIAIEGKTVNGNTNFANSICKEFLGADLLDNNLRDQGILPSRLKTDYDCLTLDENYTKERKIIKTRCYIMLLIGSLLFPKGSGSSMHVKYLPLLRNIDKIGTYSWGSTCLSYLYCSLYNNTKKDTSIFYECAVLLQTQGWYKLSSLAPINNNNFTFPYAQN